MENGLGRGEAGGGRFPLFPPHVDDFTAGEVRVRVFCVFGSWPVYVFLKSRCCEMCGRWRPQNIAVEYFVCTCWMESNMQRGPGGKA